MSDPLAEALEHVAQALNRLADSWEKTAEIQRYYLAEHEEEQAEKKRAAITETAGESDVRRILQ